MASPPRGSRIRARGSHVPEVNKRAPCLAATVLALACTGGSGTTQPVPPVEPPSYQEVPSDPVWPVASATGELPAPEPRLRRIDLVLAAADLAALEEHPDWDVMYPAHVTIDGREARGAARYRGASARTRPQKSWRIDLDPGWALEGRDRFALLAEYDDAAKLVERFAVDLYRALGLPVPYARFVNLFVNGGRAVSSACGASCAARSAKPAPSAMPCRPALLPR